MGIHKKAHPGQVFCPAMPHIAIDIHLFLATGRRDLRPPQNTKGALNMGLWSTIVDTGKKVVNAVVSLIPGNDDKEEKQITSRSTSSGSSRTTSAPTTPSGGGVDSLSLAQNIAAPVQASRGSSSTASPSGSPSRQSPEAGPVRQSTYFETLTQTQPKQTEKKETITAPFSIFKPKNTIFSTPQPKKSTNSLIDNFVEPVRKAKQEEQKRKLSQGKGPIADPVETFIERAKKQGTAKDKERAERMQSVLRSNKAKSDIKELNSFLDTFGIFDEDNEKYFSSLDSILDNTGLDKRFRQTDEQIKERAKKRKQEAFDKLLDMDYEKAEDIYDKIIKGSESDTFLNSEADFLKDIEVDITTHLADKEVGERDRQIVEERVREKTAKGIKTNFNKEWAEYVRETTPSYAGDLFARKRKEKLSGKEAKPILYMSEEQLETYYLLHESYGEDEALKYFDSIKSDIIENAKAQKINTEYTKLFKDDPWLMATGAITSLAAQTYQEGISNSFKKAAGIPVELEDVEGGLGLRTGRMTAMSEDNNWFKKQALSMLYSLEANAPETILGMVPGAKYIGAGYGGFLNAGEKFAEQYQYGILDKNGSGASIASAFVLGAANIGLIGKGVGKGITKSLLHGATRSGLNTFLANLAGTAVGGATTGVTFFGLEEAADRFFMGENSPYEVSVRNYMSEGWSEQGARDKATKDTMTGMLNSALVGSLQSTISGIGPSRKWGVDFKKAGEKIIAEEGADGIRRILNEAEGSSRKSESWINAQRLRRRQLQGKEIYADMLGAQEYLNALERQRQNAFAAGITNITGIRIKRGDVDDAVNATHAKGTITLSLNPDTDLIEVIKHDTAHGAEGANPYTFEVYKNQLRNAPGYNKAIEAMRKRRADAGLSTDKATLESEVAAEFARNFVKTVKDLDRLQRVVNGNPSLADRIYVGLRDLRAKMKAKGGTLFVDEATGIKISYDELNTLTNLYEGMLINTRDSFFADDSPMHHVKQNNDARNFGVAIDSELSAFSHKRMSGQWKHNRDEVKELIRDAYRSYKKGDTETGDKILERAGAIWSASLKKGGTANTIEEFSSYFRKQYNDGEAYNRIVARNKQNAQDVAEHNINISTYVKGLMSDIGVSKGRINPEEESAIRQAFELIKNNDEDGARELLKPFAEDLLNRAKRGHTGRDSELINFIRTARIKLDKNGEGGEDVARLQKVSRGTYNENSDARTPDSVFEELKALFPEYPWTKDTETAEAPVTEIMRMYDYVRDGAERPKYNPKDVPAMAEQLTNEIISFYRDNTPAAEETASDVRIADEAKYGRDIEGGIRSLEIDGLKETDVKECAERIRQAVDEITSAMDEAIVKSGITDTAVNKFDELTKDLIDTEAKRLMERGYTADEAEDIARHMYYEMYKSTENRVNRYVTEADNLIAKTYGRDFNPETDDPDAPPTQPKFDIFKDKKEETVNTAKAQRDRATETKKKISSLFENTAKKDFFEGTESELNSRIDEFMYDAVRNRDTAEAATEYVKEKGTTAVYRELATLSGGVTAFDTAKAWALAVEFRKRINDPRTSPEAKTRYSQLMVDVLAIMREKWTEAGQATQAIKLFNLLTLEGQLLEFKRRADAGVEAQLRKRPDYEKIKAEEAVAKRKDRANKAKQTEEDNTPKKPRKKKEKTPQSELEKLYKKYGITYIPEETFRYAQDTLKAIDDAVNANSLNDVIDIIMQNSRRRKTNTSKRLPGKLRRYYESETKLAGGDSTKPFEVLANTARQQVFAMIDDALPKGAGRKISSIHSMGMLNNVTTFIRNITSNFVLTPAETITNNLAVLPDLFMRIFTGRRTVNFELPGGYINAYRRMRKAALEQNLKVNTFIDSEGGYTGKGADRVFANGIMGVGKKFFTKLEELTGYNLTVSDETQKGIIEARVERSLKYLIEHGHLTEDEAIEIIAKEIKYRTFQDDTMLGELLDGIKTALNFKKDFGIGDFIVKFTKVPGAVITRNLEYSPAGYVKFVWTLGKTAIDMAKQRRKPSEMTATEQRDIALTLARPTTSLGIIATGAFLRSKGIIVGSDITDTGEEEEENYLLKKFRQATGVQGYKLNWDALCRFLNGEDTEIKNNDRLFEMSWMPFAPQFLTGAVMQEEAGYDFDGFKDGALDWFSVVGDIADIRTLPKTLTATTDYSLEQLSDLPALQGVRDVFENWEYRTGYVDFAVQSATDWALSFNPQMVKKLANAIDPKARDPYHAEGTIERAWQKIEASLPFIRNNVPEQIDVFGEPVPGTLGSLWKDVLNEVISPGRVSRFEENGITQELDILYKYNSDALLTTPRTTGNVAEVEGHTVRFNLYGEDYEEYSKWLGTTTMRNITEFMNSDYYKYLPYYQRADAVAQIKKESEEACRTAWAEKLCEADEATQTGILEAGVKVYQGMAETLVRGNQAKDYVQQGKVKVEDVVNCYIEKPYTKAEIAEYIADKKRGKYTENEKKAVANVLSGKSKKRHYIEGNWSELTEEQKKKVLWYIENYPENVNVPDELMEPENLVDFSEAEPPEDEDIIDITDGYSREKLITGESPGTVTAKTTTQTTGKSSTGSRLSRSGSSRSGGSSDTSVDTYSLSRLPLWEREIARTASDTFEADEAFPEISPFQKPFRFPAPFKNNKPPFIFPFKKG